MHSPGRSRACTLASGTLLVCVTFENSKEPSNLRPVSILLSHGEGKQTATRLLIMTLQENLRSGWVIRSGKRNLTRHERWFEGWVISLLESLCHASQSQQWQKEIKEMENAFLRRKNQFRARSCWCRVLLHGVERERKKRKKFRIFFIYILPYDLLRRHVFASCSAMSKIVNKVVKENTRNCALEAREARKTILPTINLHFSWMCFTLTVCTATCWKLKRHLKEIAGWCATFRRSNPPLVSYKDLRHVVAWSTLTPSALWHWMRFSILGIKSLSGLGICFVWLRSGCSGIEWEFIFQL